MAFYKVTIELIFESSGDAMNALARLMECRIYRLCSFKVESTT
jgi:hypothetical protein